MLVGRECTFKSSLGVCSREETKLTSVLLLSPLSSSILCSNLAAAAVLLLSGYLGIRAFFLHTFAYNGTSSLVLLCLFAFFTGAGSSAGLSGGMNSVAKVRLALATLPPEVDQTDTSFFVSLQSFPDKTRATATGVVLAGFGLSAFLFSTISHTFFPGNTGDFLFLLAVGCFIPMALGVVLVVPVPPAKHRPHPHHTEESNWDRIASSSSATGYLPIPDQSDAESGAETEDEEAEGGETRKVRTRRDGTVIELSPSRSAEAGSLTKVVSRVSVAPSAPGDDGEGMTGMRLVKEMDFWILAAIVSCLSGTGLMCESRSPLAFSIERTLTRSLFFTNARDQQLRTLDARPRHQRQPGRGSRDALKAAGDSGLDDFDLELHGTNSHRSVAPFLLYCSLTRARPDFVTLSPGILTDVAKHRFAIRRIHFMSLVSLLFILSQVVALYTTDVGSLWIVSSLLGIAYGGLFGLAPVITLEWFGLCQFYFLYSSSNIVLTTFPSSSPLANFSLNWGFVSMSPILGGNVANLIYGRIYDSHTVRSVSLFARSLVAR